MPSSVPLTAVDPPPAVEIVPDLARTQELAERYRTASVERGIRVTELADLRSAFWKERLRWPIAPERQATVDRGVDLHRALGAVVGPGVALEVRFRRAGIVGQIDALGGPVIELKTGGRGIAPEEWRSHRPDALVQLVTYCALADREEGWLVRREAPESGSGSLSVAEFHIPDLATRRAAAVARAERLREAIRTGDPSALPACRWFDRGCEFRAAQGCTCTGTEPADPLEILDGLPPPARRPDVEAEWSQRWRGYRAPATVEIDAIHDLIYPRRAYFDRLEPEATSPPPPPGPADEMRARLRAAMESGPIGDLAVRLPMSAWAPGPIETWRGEPFLRRVRNQYTPPAAEELAPAAPQVAWELGFRCAALGSPTAHLVLGWGRCPPERSPVFVFRYRFPDLGAIARRWRGIARALAETRADGRAERLPACPAWYAANCPHQPRCGCPSDRDSR